MIKDPKDILVIEKSEYDKLKQRYDILQDGYNHECNRVDSIVKLLHEVQDEEERNSKIWNIMEDALEICSEHEGNK